MAQRQGDIRYRYTDAKGNPLTKCPACKHDLTDEENGIDLILNMSGGREMNYPTYLDPVTGLLIDTIDNAVGNGRHSATCCGGCHEMLIDCVGVQEEEDPETDPDS